MSDDLIPKLHEHLSQLDNSKKGQAEKFARFDLEKKVYPEIQDRLTKVNDWLITKVVFAGALLGAFLLNLWWPYWSQNLSDEDRQARLDEFYRGLLKSNHTCAVLGIACTVL